MTKKYYLLAVALFAMLGLSSCNIADILDELDDDDEFLIEKSHGDKHSEAEKIAKEYLGSYPCELGIIYFNYSENNGSIHFTGVRDNHLWMSSYCVEDMSLYNTWTSDREFYAEQEYLDEYNCHDYFDVKEIKPKHWILYIGGERGTRELFTFKLISKNGEDFYKTIYVDNVQGKAFETTSTRTFEGRNIFIDYPVIYDKMYDEDGNVIWWFSDFGVGLPLNHKEENVADISFYGPQVFGLKAFRYVDGHGVKVDYINNDVLWDVDLKALFPDAESVSCEDVGIQNSERMFYYLKVKQGGKTSKKYVYLNRDTGELLEIKTLM